MTKTQSPQGARSCQGKKEEDVPSNGKKTNVSLPERDMKKKQEEENTREEWKKRDKGPSRKKRRMEEERQRAIEEEERRKRELEAQERERQERLELERQQEQERREATQSAAVKRQAEELFSAQVLFKGDNSLKTRQPLSTPGFQAEVAEEIHPALKKRKLVTLDGKPFVTVKEQPKLSPEALKALISNIPTDKSALYEYTIDWEIVDKHNMVETNMKPWITAKITEFLGEEEPTLVNYICKKLSEHAPPEETEKQLNLVLEDDAVDFMIKMWRRLIYHVLVA
eukprot:TRINITY_DN309_c1_g1_i1.p1 TRINITY_DN309_c1_g1~~TRINITY_DN309_c1_g1_i1.p1  ORF type:complete len:283 (+),score=109.24 TRINITY_DN309_c1_g1_i1:1069-1917(+)